MQGSDFADYVKKVSKQAPYSGEMTFWRLPLSKDLQGVDVAIIGSPFDISVTNRPGARFGPRGLREQSLYVGLFPTLYPWDFRPKEEFKIIDYGDIQYIMASVDDFLRKSENEVSDIMNSGASVLGLGGDHLTSLPIIRAVSKKHGKISVVHFDSHTDTYPTEVLTHGSVFYQLMQEDHVVPNRSIQLGIRTPWDDSLGYHVKDIHWVRKHTPEEIAAEIKETVGNNKVFLSFDVDFIDASYVPGTGTPVVGGPDTYTAREILFNLKGLNLVGADVVEVSPILDVASMTQIVGSTIALDLLHLLCLARKQY